jgi:hypothetical protein
MWQDVHGLGILYLSVMAGVMNANVCALTKVPGMVTSIYTAGCSLRNLHRPHRPKLLHPAQRETGNKPVSGYAGVAEHTHHKDGIGGKRMRGLSHAEINRGARVSDVVENPAGLKATPVTVCKSRTSSCKIAIWPPEGVRDVH